MNAPINACDEENYEDAYYAGILIDQETRTCLRCFPGTDEFPSILREVLGKNFNKIRSRCYEHEEKLLQFVKDKKIRINIYRNTTEFIQYFKERTT